MIRHVAATPIQASRRYDFPPLWAVPVLLLVAIGAIFYAGEALGVLGLIPGVYVIVRLQHKADAYVRSRDTAE